MIIVQRQITVKITFQDLENPTAIGLRVEKGVLGVTEKQLRRQ